MKCPVLFFLVFIHASVCRAQKPVEFVQPKKEFDIKLASGMLNGGNAIIKGDAYYEGKTIFGLKSDGKVYARTGSVVSLYPLTPYIEEYLELKKTNKEGRRIATITPLAGCYRIEAKIFSAKGEFIIPGLKPGKYYLECDVYFPAGTGTRKVSEIVEIKADNETVNCSLKKTLYGHTY